MGNTDGLGTTLIIAPICVLALGVYGLGYCIGRGEGYQMGAKKYQKMMIDEGIAGHNETTGEWQLKTKKSSP